MTRVLSALILLLPVGCAANSNNLFCKRALTAEAEALAGARAAVGLEADYGGVVRMDDAEKRMRGIACRLSENVAELEGPFICRVLDNEILNGSSLPGGRIYITRGLYNKICDNEEVLAAFIAHELAHIASKDHFKPRCATNVEAIEREEAADALGAVFLKRAGIRSMAMVDIIRIVEDCQPVGWAKSRIKSVIKSISEADNVVAFAN